MSGIAQQIYGENLEPQLPVDATFLNRRSEVMEDDVREFASILTSVREAPIVSSFIEKTGMDVDPENGEVMFFGEESIQCRDMVILKNALLMAGLKEEEFRPVIARLRAQYAGLFYYHLKMIDLHGEGKVDEMLGLMREMNDRKRYPVRIYQDKSMMDGVLDEAEDFKSARKVFNFMANNKYRDSEGQEKLVCEPDEEMFRIWLGKCEKAKHYKRVYQMVQRLDSDVRMPVTSWLLACEDADDYSYFFANIADPHKGYEPSLNHFLHWYSVIQTYKQLDDFIDCLISHDVEPDARLFGMIVRQSGLKEDGGFGAREFIDRFNEKYSSPETSKRVSSRGMTRFHELVMSGLTQVRA